MGKLIVELPDEVHGELKKKAISSQKTIKDVVTDLIRGYITEEKKKKAAAKETGLCGTWEDERSAEEIIKDIKAQRRWFKRQVN